MKTIIALSLALIYGSTFAAQESTIEKAAEKEPVKQENVVAPSTSTEKSAEKVIDSNKKDEACVTKEVKKAPVKKKPKPVKKVVPVAKVDNSVLLTTDYYHVPKGSSETDTDWAQKINYSDVDVYVESKKSDPLIVSFIDKRNNTPLDPHFFKKMENFNSDVNITAVKSDLSDATTTTYNFNGPQPLEFATQHVQGYCDALFVTYHLKTQDEEKTVVKFISQDGTLTNTPPQDCPLNYPDSKELTLYTPAGNIVDIGFNRKVMGEGKFGATIHFTKDGREYFPNIPYAYLFNKDLSKVHYLKPIYNSKNPYFGVSYNQPLPPGNYYMLLGIKYELGIDWIKTSFGSR